MTSTEKLYQAIQDLPEPVIAEILDFAEFLRAKSYRSADLVSNEPLTTLLGGLENSVTFAGEPLLIQKRLRDEWQ
jgi:hypothetical protein